MFKRKKSVLDDVCKNSPWYAGSDGADSIKSSLAGKPDGSFLVRDSSSQPGNYVLSYVFEDVVKNVHIDGDNGVCKLAKSAIKFKNLTELVRHYSENETAELHCSLSGATFASADAIKDAKKTKAKSKARSGTLSRGKKTKDSDAIGSQWRVSDVCDWLQSMEMPEYIPTFKKNKIDGCALVVLTDADLKELGVGAPTQRKKLVTAIENLNYKFKAMQSPSPETSGPNIAPTSAVTPVSTLGLIARNIDGVLKIFDVNTGEEVKDIAAHQAKKERAARELAAAGLVQNNEPTPPPAMKSPDFRQNEHEEKMWFDRRLPKNRIGPLLESGPNGSFVVRDSASNPGCFAFSYLADGKVQHKLIEESDAGFHFKSCEEVFPTVCNLIYHYTMTPGLALKCVLVYPTERERYSDAQIESQEEVAPAPVPKTNAKPSWDAMDLDKSGALAKINGKPQGSFVIRASDKSYAAISVIRPDGTMYHQHIAEVPGGLQLKKATSVHVDLHAFVQYYSQQSQSDLPCPLLL